MSVRRVERRYRNSHRDRRGVGRGAWWPREGRIPTDLGQSVSSTGFILVSGVVRRGLETGGPWKWVPWGFSSTGRDGVLRLSVRVLVVVPFHLPLAELTNKLSVSHVCEMVGFQLRHC